MSRKIYLQFWFFGFCHFGTWIGASGEKWDAVGKKRIQVVDYVFCGLQGTVIMEADPHIISDP